jgi:hypothetical protein
MSQLGEPLGIGMADANEIDCPFDHDPGDPPVVKNDFIGDGQVLGPKMESPAGIYLYSKLKAANPPEKDISPQRRPGHAFEGGKKPVKIEDGTTIEYFPVSCAAHHLIPAQASLKNHKLLQFMCKKGEANALKGGSFSGGRVWANVGYDVNGQQNGIWLPGSYAVKGSGGMWASASDSDGDEPIDPPPASGPTSVFLRGSFAINKTNPRWQYVSQAVRLTPGQFHDAHPDYSKFVRGLLTKIFINYETLFRQKIEAGECGECKKRADKFKQLGFPTPFGLVSRLHKVQAKLAACLNGTTWRPNIYTSRWGKAYMATMKRDVLTI